MLHVAAAKEHARLDAEGAAPAPEEVAKELDEAPDDLLPDDVIAAVMQRSWYGAWGSLSCSTAASGCMSGQGSLLHVRACREAEAAAGRQASALQETGLAQQSPKAKRKRMNLSQPRQVGPVVVQVLSHLPRAQPSGVLCHPATGCSQPISFSPWIWQEPQAAAVPKACKSCPCRDGAALLAGAHAGSGREALC